MTYLRGILSALAAIFVALFGRGLLFAFSEIDRQTATGLGAVAGGLVGSLLSPVFWLLAISLFCLFFAASRLGNKVLRVVLFWIPTVGFSVMGLAFVALFAYAWVHFRQG